jgi:hypothetical protein
LLDIFHAFKSCFVISEEKPIDNADSNFPEKCNHDETNGYSARVFILLLHVKTLIIVNMFAKEAEAYPSNINFVPKRSI